MTADNPPPVTAAAASAAPGVTAASSNPKRSSLRAPSKSFSRSSLPTNATAAAVAASSESTISGRNTIATSRPRQRDSLLLGTNHSNGSATMIGRPARSRTLEQATPPTANGKDSGNSGNSGGGLAGWDSGAARRNSSSTSLHINTANTGGPSRSPCPSPVSGSRPDTGKMRQTREERHARAAEARRQLGRSAEEVAAEHTQIYSQMINEWRESEQRRLMERVARGIIGATGSTELGIGAGDGETLAEENQRIKVYVRARPMNQRELSLKQCDLMTIGQRPTATHPYAKLFLHEPKLRLDRLDQRKRVSMDTHTFRFDDAFDADANNEDVYLQAVEPLIQAMRRPGARVTLFAYGQTGSGKTHTMFGTDGIQRARPATGSASTGKHAAAKLNDTPQLSVPGNATPPLPTTGIHEMALHDLFAVVEDMSAHIRLVPVLCFFEIHRNRIHDLLQDRARCTLRSDRHGRTRIVGLREVPLDSPDAALEFIRLGNSHRTIGTTGLNATASRSHAVVQVILREELERTTADGKPRARIYAKMSLVDLAGSERAAESKDASHQERVEGGGINRSLLALKECIRALSRLSAVKIPVPGKETPPQQQGTPQEGDTPAEGDTLDLSSLVPPHSPALSAISVATTATLAGPSGIGPNGQPHLGHVPFRASQLTLVLKDSLISPEAHTAVIACITPASGSVEHTSNTLRYARRVKTIRVRRRKRARRRMVRRTVRQLNANNEEELIEVEVEVEIDDDDDDGNGSYLDYEHDDDDDDDDDESEDADVDLLDLDDTCSVAGESVLGELETAFGDHQLSVTSPIEEQPSEPELTPEELFQLAVETPLPGHDQPSQATVLYRADYDEDLLVDPQHPTAIPAFDSLLNCHQWALQQHEQLHNASYQLLQTARLGRIDEATYLAQLERVLRERLAVVDALAAVTERRRRDAASEQQQHQMLMAVGLDSGSAPSFSSRRTSHDSVTATTALQLLTHLLP